MWLPTVIITVIFIVSVTFFLRKRIKPKLKDKEVFDDYVAKKGLSLDEQRELCVQLGLDHQIGSRAYESVEDWQKELTTVWKGSTSDIKFGYRKYTDTENRLITPTEFGFDGNKKPFIRGICHRSNSNRTFKTARIETKIEVDGHLYDLCEWLTLYLEVDLVELKQNYKVCI